MSVTLYYNPKCSTCRAAKDLLEQHNADVTLMKYLETPPSRQELIALADKLGDKAEQMVRKKEPLFTELQLEDRDLAAQIEAIAEHPQLLQRPIAVSGDKAIVARPADVVVEIL